MAVWKLPYLTNAECSLRPYLFYVAFGPAELSDLAAAWSGSLSQGLESQSTKASFFQNGAPWERLQADHPALAKEISGAPAALAIQGEIARLESLDYLRETLDLLTHLVDHGACGVYDPLTLTWWPAEAWEAMVADGSIFNPFDHVAVLASPEPRNPDQSWIHTRGLRKFGRPDLSVRAVAQNDVNLVTKMLDRFVNFQALGGLIEAGREVRIEGLEGCYRPGPLTGDLDDPDFNNVHVELAKD